MFYIGEKKLWKQKSVLQIRHLKKNQILAKECLKTTTAEISEAEKQHK